jgi:hypothetical protein
MADIHLVYRQEYGDWVAFRGQSAYDDQPLVDTDKERLIGKMVLAHRFGVDVDELLDERGKVPALEPKRLPDDQTYICWTHPGEVDDQEEFTDDECLVWIGDDNNYQYHMCRSCWERWGRLKGWFPVSGNDVSPVEVTP